MTADASGLELPCNARELYSRELHRQRTRAGWSFQQLADKTKFSKPHLHGVEVGTRTPYPPVSEKLDEVFGTEVLFQGIYAAVRRESALKRFDHCLKLEAKAVRIQEYSGTVVSGLLQTEAYMRALFCDGNPGAPTGKIDDMVAKRLSRQKVLHRDPPPDHWFILDEAVLRRPVGGPAIMRDQLGALLPRIYAERSTIQVVPFEIGTYSLMGAVHILLSAPDGSTTVYNEAAGYGETFSDQASVTRRLREYDRLKACALSPEASVAMIKEAMEKYERCEPFQI
ncbi:helix-turn-helix domain-containing protein [Streptomyces acidiscabies]|uniref:HTH cro/C1-type domain-containing protein n=1 Tax=Streptomyces acidiscabies TaxID=42234 RepID=A0A0L0KBY1_9ACTN|nr:helix-turn-helix transcriptional regulator [Streptomyces acidiscabies]KND35587.1 hypothetical protein IQ63_14385 [Streptomyces acidiscabies]